MSIVTLNAKQAFLSAVVRHDMLPAHSAGSEGCFLTFELAVPYVRMLEEIANAADVWRLRFDPASSERLDKALEEWLAA